MARVRQCQEIVQLPGGHTYVCGRHTRNPHDRCQQHRPPPKQKQPRQPIRPNQLSQPIPGDYETPDSRPDGRTA